MADDIDPLIGSYPVPAESQQPHYSDLSLDIPPEDQMDYSMGSEDNQDPGQ